MHPLYHLTLRSSLCLALCGALRFAEAQPAIFDVFEYRVEGTTLLPRGDIERAVYRYMGERKTAQDVDAARAALEKLYHDRGYLTVLVDLPQQRVTSRVVVLNVVEAPVDKLRIIGSRYHSLEAIRDGVPSLAEGSVPNFQNAQQDLAQINRSADRRVLPVLKPSDTPGKVDVDLKVQDELPLHASLEVNNKYSTNTSKTRAIAQLRYDNLFQRNHSLNLQYQIAPERPRDGQVVSLSYVIPTRSDLTWAFYALRSRSDVAVVGDLTVVGNGNIYGARLIQSLPPAGEAGRFSHSLTYGLDYKDFGQSIQLGSNTVSSPVHYAPLSTQYSAVWQGAAAADGETDGSTTKLDIGLNVLLRGLSARREQFANKGAGTSPSFYIWRGGLQRDQRLPARWSLLAQTDFQWAREPLISNEGFSAGGADSVRGYTESERLGDDGVRASLELHSPSLLGGDGNSAPAGNAFLLGFVEGAHLVVRKPQAGQQSRFDLASVGLGLRINLRGFNLDLDWARALSNGSTTRNGDQRVLFRVSYGL